MGLIDNVRKKRFIKMVQEGKEEYKIRNLFIKEKYYEDDELLKLYLDNSSFFDKDNYYDFHDFFLRFDSLIQIISLDKLLENERVNNCIINIIEKTIDSLKKNIDLFDYYNDYELNRFLNSDYLLKLYNSNKLNSAFNDKFYELLNDSFNKSLDSGLHSDLEVENFKKHYELLKKYDFTPNFTNNYLKTLLGRTNLQRVLYELGILTQDDVNALFEYKYNVLKNIVKNDNSSFSYYDTDYDIDSSLIPTSEFGIYWAKLSEEVGFDAMYIIMKYLKDRINKNSEFEYDYFDEYSDEELYNKWKEEIYDKETSWFKEMHSDPKQYFYDNYLSIKRAIFDKNGKLTDFLFSDIDYSLSIMECFFDYNREGREEPNRYTYYSTKDFNHYYNIFILLCHFIDKVPEYYRPILKQYKKLSELDMDFDKKMNILKKYLLLVTNGHFSEKSMEFYDETGLSVKFFNYLKDSLIYNIDKVEVLFYIYPNLDEKMGKNAIKKINIYKNNETIIKMLNIDELYDNIESYFDENGPTEKIYSLALFNLNLFQELYKTDEWKKYYKVSPSVNNYIEFTKKYGLVFKNIINEYNLIEKYFDENGPTEKIYSLALFDQNLFQELYKTDEWKNHYKVSPSINNYIEFTKKYGLIFINIINKYNLIEKYFDENGPTEALMIELNNSNTDQLLSSLAHNDKVLNNMDNDFVNLFKYYLLDKYFSKLDESVSEKKYEYLLSKLGCKILFNFETDNVKKLIETDFEVLDKLFDLIDPTKESEITSNVLYSKIIPSISSIKFSKDHSDDANIFVVVYNLVDRLSIDDLKELNNDSQNNKLIIRLNNWIDKIISIVDIDKSELLEVLYNCKSSDLNTKVEAEKKLRKYCKKYTKELKNNYCKENKEIILKEIGAEEVYLEKEAITELTKRYISDESFNYAKFCQISNGKLDITEEQFNLLMATLREGNKLDPSVRKIMKPFKVIIEEYITYLYKNGLIENNILESLNVKKVQVLKLDELNIFDIIREIDLDIVIDEIISNNELYSSLKNLIEQNYIGRLPSKMQIYFENTLGIKLPGGINNIGKFITRYSQILIDEQRNLKRNGVEISDISEIHFRFSDIIKRIASVNSETIEIRLLFGKDVYDDFISNKGPNTGQGTKTQREEKVAEISDYLYLLDKITIPSKDIIINDGDVELNLIVGNRTNPANICHGERTGACMRVGGVGEGLFIKCLTDKNWFHIRIENPITHEYISRVSGFRNGNTVYLNQLRCVPVGSKYTNENLQVIIKKYADSLIEETKDSEYPIENVFINIGYAMSSYTSKNYSLGYGIQAEYNLSDVQHLCLRANDIWTDVRNNAVLLATTEEGKITKEGYAPLKNGPDAALEYECVRDKIYGLNNSDYNIGHRFVTVDVDNLYDIINRVNAMKRKLEGIDYRSTLSLECNGIKDGYACSDWYVFVDDNYEIHYDCISQVMINNELVKYNGYEKAKEEMNYYINYLQSKYNLNEEVKYAI